MFTWSKWILRAFLFGLASIVLSELFLRAIESLEVGRELSEEIARLRAVVGGRASGPVLDPAAERGFDRRIELHPFFGFVYGRSDSGVNNQGVFAAYDFAYGTQGWHLVDAPETALVGGHFRWLLRQPA